MSEAPALPIRVRFVESARLRLGAERGFIFDECTGRVYSLNTSAAVAAARFQEDPSVEAVVTAVVEAFDVDAARARRDLAGFVDQLVAEGLAVTEG